MTCPQSVMTGLYESSVSIVCTIVSTPPVSDAHITWEAQQHLRPAAGSGWPPGVKFDRDDEYMAFFRQVNLPT